MPIYGCPNDPSRAEEDNEFLGVMADILNLQSVACQESALHGLGHWQMHYPVIVAKLIDEFLARNQQLRAELRQYALSAQYGMVQ